MVVVCLQFNIGTLKAATRVGALLEAGAHIVLVAPLAEVADELKEKIDSKRVTHINRHFQFSDLQSVDMAIYCLSDAQAAKTISQACKKVGMRTICAYLYNSSSSCQLILQIIPSCVTSYYWDNRSRLWA